MSETRLWWRFWSKVLVGNECWEWSAGRDHYGYGALRLNGRMQKAHRVAWELWHGPIPGDMDVLHHCDNPPCVRPGHLFLGTQAENMADADRKGRLIYPRSINGLKTYCPKGHPLDGIKTYGGYTHRFCRTCKREQDRAYKAQRKEAAK